MYEAALGVLPTPLATSLTIRPGQELCACLGVSGYHTPSEVALKEFWVLFQRESKSGSFHGLMAL